MSSHTDTTSKLKKQKCKHDWSGQVNERWQHPDLEKWEATGDNKEEYVICRKCAGVKILRTFEVTWDI